MKNKKKKMAYGPARMAVRKKKGVKMSKRVVETCDDLLSIFTVDDLNSLIQEISSGLSDKRESRFNAIPKSTMKSLVKESARLEEGLSLSVKLEMPFTVEVDFYLDMFEDEVHMDVMDISEDAWDFVTQDVLMKQKAVKDKVAKQKKDLKALRKKLESVAEEHGVDVGDLADEVRIRGGY